MALEHDFFSSRKQSAADSPPLVLAVEDDAVSLKLIRVTLATRYLVTTATHGGEALEIAMAQTPDLILSDVRMPVMDGCALLHALQGVERLEQVPMILLSGDQDEELRLRMLREGARDFLRKPISTDELLARVDLHIDASLARQTLQAQLLTRQRELADLSREMAHRMVQLESMSRRVVEAQEAERQRLAREMHDEIGQQLTGLKLMLEAMADGPAARVGERVEAAVRLVVDVMRQVRDISVALHPPELREMGLLASLLSHVDRFSRQAGMDVRVEHHGLGQALPPAVELSAFRIVQEALTNVARHAGVKQATVRAQVSGGQLHLAVVDRGRGIPRHKVDTCSFGLAGMRERAMQLGGSCTIHALPEGGTCVEARLPIQLDSDDRGGAE